MTLLLLEGAARTSLVRIDLALLTARTDIAGIDGVPPGAHWVSVCEGGAWRARWVVVAPGDERVGFDGARTAAGISGQVVAYPGAEHGTWLSLTSHVRADPVAPADVPDAGLTRFERLVGAFGGAAGVLDELERSFIEWVLPPDGGVYEPRAGERWRRTVIALAAASDRGIAAEPGLVVAAAHTLAAQLSQLSAGIVAPSLEAALLELVADLRDGGHTDAAAVLRAAL